jgi:hypothetical protein
MPIICKRTGCIALRTIGSVQRRILRGKKRPTKGEETVCHGAQRAVVMKASPRSAFEVVEAKLLLEFLVVALDAPAKFGQAHERGDAGAQWQIGQPELIGCVGVARLLA